jgi:uncharacterized repeat protein (TIGR01451 family)
MQRSGLVRALFACAIALTIALFAVSAAQATTFNVDSTADVGDSDTTDTVCNDGSGGCTLRAAIDQANAQSSDDVIQLEAKRYKQELKTSFEDENADGDFDVADNGTLTINGKTSDPRDTVISANGLDRVIQVLGGANLTLQNLTVTDGWTSELNGAGIEMGGDVFFTVTAPRHLIEEPLTALALNNANVVNNVTTDGGDGGGIEATCETSITLNGAHVDRNTATDSDGNAFADGGGIATCGSLDAIDSTIDGNNSKAGLGGGIATNGPTVLTRTSVSGNRIFRDEDTDRGEFGGGGIFTNNDLTIVDGTIDDNRAEGDGGGIHSEGGTLDLTRTSVSNNSLGFDWEGGGLYVDNDEDNTFTDSTIDSNFVPAGSGGGVYLEEGTLDAAGTNFNKNSAANDGGGIYSDGNDVTLSGSTVDDNGDQSFIDSGGAIFGGCCSGDLKISGSSVSGNATEGAGGGVWWAGSSQTITDSVVDHNNSDDGRGGGVWNATGALEVTRSSASHNHSGDDGGGIYNGINAPITVTDADVNDNKAGDQGGGIYDDGRELTVHGTSISRNASFAQGGGIWHDDNGDGLVVNSTISGNHSDVGQDEASGGGEGGGIFQDGVAPGPGLTVGSTLTLKNATIAENESDDDDGGGVFTRHTPVEMTNVLFANNTRAGQENNCAPTEDAFFTSNGHNLATDDGGECNLDTTIGDVVNASPKLGAIKNNAGPSETQALKDGSDAIDAGDDSVCTDSDVNSVDQRGFTRPFGPSCDIGAYETGYADVAIVAIGDSPDPVAAGGNVAYTITVQNIGPSPDTATGVVLHDAIPGGTSLVSATSSQGSCSGADCSLGSLAEGATATVTVTVTTSSPGTITDNASVSATTGDPDPSNNSASENTTVLGAGAAIVAPGPGECTPSAPRSSISRNGFQAKTTTIKLVGRTIDFRCAGQTAAGGIKQVRLAIALKDGSKCRFIKHNGDLTASRSCDNRVYFKARLGTIRNGKVPWTFRIRHLDLPRGKYVAFASGIDSQDNAESKARRFNKKTFRVH